MAEEQPLPLTEPASKGKKSASIPFEIKTPAEPAPAEPPAVETAPEPPAQGAPAEITAGDDGEPKKRRGRPAGAGPRKGKGAGEEVLFLVETEPESGQYASEEIPTTSQLLDILDSGRQVIATRSWRQF